VSKSAAIRVIDHLGMKFALQPRKRFTKDAVLIVDGTLVPTRDHNVAEQSNNFRDSTIHQVVIDADTRLVVVVGRPMPGNRNVCRAWAESGAKAAVGNSTTIADSGCPGTGVVIPHRRHKGKDWAIQEGIDAVITPNMAASATRSERRRSGSPKKAGLDADRPPRDADSPTTCHREHHER
jgi:hypothetical protein